MDEDGEVVISRLQPEVDDANNTDTNTVIMASLTDPDGSPGDTQAGNRHRDRWRHVDVDSLRSSYRVPLMSIPMSIGGLRLDNGNNSDELYAGCFRRRQGTCG